MSDQYTVGELAEVAGVSRRTVRYYVQEELLPPPRGRGRGAYYEREHLERLLQVKAMQERGMSLVEIHRVLDAPPSTESGLATNLSPPARRSVWTRVEIAPGVELHLGAGRRLPSRGRLLELMDWCHRHLQNGKESEE